jgi:hypothetical protein
MAVNLYFCACLKLFQCCKCSGSLNTATGIARRHSAEPSGAHARAEGLSVVLLLRDASHCCARGRNTVLVVVAVVLWESLIVEIVTLRFWLLLRTLSYR